MGNFIADHLRGNQLQVYPAGIIEGIRLHRRIDQFTDSHEEFRKSKRIFYEGFEKYSGILVDIYFDHLLARDFEKYSGKTLGEFSEAVYKVYSDHRHMLPEGSARFLDYVIKNNIYTAYSGMEGIERVLFHLSHRIGHDVRLDHSVKTFLGSEEQLTKGFEVFFRDIMSEFIKP